MTASIAGWQAFTRTYSTNAGSEHSSFGTHRAGYALLEAYYNNNMFEGNYSQWAAYKRTYNLYRNINGLYNPTRRLVNFYTSNIWRGALSEDGSKLPKDMALAIPFSSDTPPKLRSAAAQLWQWSNFQSLKSTIPNECSKLGATLVEICDERDRGKVMYKQVHPATVVGLELDYAGNVNSYAIEYRAQEGPLQPIKGGMGQGFEGRYYTYRKEVDHESYRYYKDGQPFAYGDEEAVIPNPYGFVPAVWFMHTPGGNHGDPAIAGSLGKIDRLNSTASQLHDYVGKAVASPKVIFANGNITRLAAATTKRGATDEFSVPTADTESVSILTGQPGGSVADLITSLDIKATLEVMQSLIDEIEKDHPELNFYKELRQMSSLTGPAARQSTGDAEALLLDAQALYDQQMIKMLQMGIAIAGMRANERIAGSGWQDLTRQQKKFRDYDLDSYRKGNLDMAIESRPLVKLSDMEKAQERQMYWSGIKTEIEAGVPLELALQDDWTPEKLAELKTLKDEKVKQQQELFSSQQQPSQGLQQPNNQPAQQMQNGAKMGMVNNSK